MSALARFARPAAPVGALRPGSDRPRAADAAGAALSRFTRPRPRAVPGEACELCAAAIDAGHPHLVDATERGLVCACRACALLFVEPTQRYRAVPDEYVRVEPFVLPPAGWNALQIPVGMAFFMVHSQLHRTVAFYPSPAGATECDLDLAAWSDVVADNPPLARLRADVQAALVRVGDAAHGPPVAPGGATTARTSDPSCRIVPIDRCYELVGELRVHWRGFDGGQEVRERLDAFFAQVDRRAGSAP